jgi:hypothetical protein
MENQYEKLVILEQKVNKIIDLLQGNSMDKNDTGVTGTISDHDKRLEKLEKVKDRLTWTIAGMFMPTSIGLWEIVRKIFTKQ